MTEVLEKIEKLKTYIARTTIAQNSIIEHMNTELRSLMETLTTIQIISLAAIAVIIALCIAILLNQRKLKKQLQQLLDAKEDKPA